MKSEGIRNKFERILQIDEVILREVVQKLEKQNKTEFYDKRERI